ncbi:MAG: undecaprenyl/decaprenyl-phosphate alpha-N-acetylglucosaminyl 1-phosphate transferase [Bacteroidetes bacterium]|nr:undecaprenyl/decaprenyl-phosphate alpha-N-acetylglucosaminyl 1-phosphate transferase [Bacteroidota bacterium]
MIQVAAGIIIAYLVTFFLLPLVIRIADDNKLYDLPDERKLHCNKVSSLGGIGIFSGIILSLLLVADFSNYSAELQYFIACFFMIFLIGIIDDIFVLKAWKKILGQVLITLILTLKANLLITNLHGFLGIYELTYSESIYISFFTITLLINSFNLIDGVDGLAGSIGFISCLLFGTFFLMNNLIHYAVLSFCVCGALLAFLKYNFSPAKIFMGDSGSTLIGLIAAILAIKFVESASIQSEFLNESAPAIAFGFLLIPLLDVLRVFAIRIYKKQSPLVPDRNHLHHLLQNKGLTHTQVTLTLVAAQLLFAALTLLAQHLNINLIIALQFTLYFSSVYMLKEFIPKRRKLHVVHNQSIDVLLPDLKVYPIFTKKEKVSISED